MAESAAFLSDRRRSFRRFARRAFDGGAQKTRSNGNQVRFAGIGGPRMQAEGIDLFFPQEELAHFGLFELLRHVPHLLKRMKETEAEIRRVSPAALITIDAPDFCFRVARKLKGEGIPLIHYVAPTVWAWRPGRARKIAQFLDHLLALLPFEPPYFTREGLGCTFVGHSIIESKAAEGDAVRFREKFKIASDAELARRAARQPNERSQTPDADFRRDAETP